MLKMMFRNLEFNLSFPIQTQGLVRCAEAALSLIFEEDKYLVYSSSKAAVSKIRYFCYCGRNEMT